MITDALCFTAPRRVEVRTRTLPPLGPTDVLVKVKAVGVCFGDIALFRDDDESLFPSWGGHEAAGVVEDVGPAVTGVRPGDAVALLGQERFSVHTVAPERDVAPIRTSVKDWAHWVAEPLACCVNGVEQAAIRPADSVAVVGCGFMGLGLVQVLKRLPAQTVVAIDVRESSLEHAREMGADATFLSTGNIVEAAASTCIPRPMPNQYLGPGYPSGPFDVVFEASGSKPGLDTATALTRIGGTLVLFGHQAGQVTVDGTAWHMKGLRVLNASPMSATDFHEEFYRTVGLLDAGHLALEPLITHTADFTDAQALFEGSTDGGYVKGVLRF